MSMNTKTNETLPRRSVGSPTMSAAVAEGLTIVFAILASRKFTASTR
jgi:hypothetical protein